MSNYHEVATESRLKCLDLVYKAQTSHIGSLMGAADIFAVLFSKIDLDKDKFILSAGWKACLLYFHLWKLGRITLEELDSYCMEGSKFIGLAEPIHPDIPFAGGSMGYGLPAAVGFALAKKLKGEEGTVYCLMSDGELQIGTTWESLLIAAQQKLDNLVVIVDGNGLQAMGELVLDVSAHSLTHFGQLGWQYVYCDGHDYEKLAKYITSGSTVGLSWNVKKPGCPYLVYANTTKGKGVSFMENNNLYHYKALSEEEYERATGELLANNIARQVIDYQKSNG